jgi:hypothetical protein
MSVHINNAIPLLRKWKIPLALLGVIVVGYAWYVYMQSPGRIVRLAFLALDRHDVDSLVALASKKERETVSLTPDTVRDYLLKTWWRDSRIKPSVSVKPPNAQFANVLAYEAEVTGFSRDGRPRKIQFEVYRDAQGVWRLGLSPLLYIMPRICNEVEGDHAPVWDALARQSGIRGVVGADGKVRYSDGTFARFLALIRD